jgi:hypothetical protein
VQIYDLFLFIRNELYIKIRAISMIIQPTKNSIAKVDDHLCVYD